jgi:tetratricopeptide (TPR) repeat protein
VAERRALVRHPTDDPVAYEAYLRARHATFQGTEEGLVQALDLLQRATARDPRFALAYKLLAAAYVALALDGYMRPADALPIARSHIGRAAEIDPQLAEAHATLSAIAFFFNWDWAAAEREWAKYQGLPSGLFQTQELVGYSFERWVLAGPNGALRVVRRLRELDPLTTSYAVLEADYLFHGGQLEAAAALYQKTIDDDATPAALFGLAEVRHAQGRFDEALDVLRRAHLAAGDDALMEAFDTARGEEGYRQIDRAAVQLELESLRTRAATAYVSPLDFARAHAQLGNREEAFSHFDAAFADRAPGLVFLKVDRAWDNIRDDPRFAKYVRQVGLP